MFFESMNTSMMLLYLTRLMITFLINPLHEFAHAFTAHKLGDDTAKQQGRMTIDPILHLDALGALILLMTGFGWAKPVPINPANFKHKNLDLILVSVAGPLTNLLAAFLGMAAIRMIGGFETFVSLADWYCIPDGSSEGYLMWMLYWFTDINILLFVFNMLPVPPLDGSRVLLCFLPPRAAVWFMKRSRIFSGILIVCALLGILPLSLICQWIARGMGALVSFLPVVM